jgi:hypothetical protein
MFKPEDIISCYTRAEALEDGVLRDVSSVAGPIGFKIPVAVTAGVWAEYVAAPFAAPDSRQQKEEERLFELLWVACMSARNCKDRHADRLTFDLQRMQPSQGEDALFAPARLVLSIGAGDQGEPVATILFPYED